ncbi:MAG: motility protein A [Actinomycetota bacterium]|nr:motility protein A [Actinomycetota bacterium]
MRRSPATVIGLVAACSLLLVAAMMEGTTPAAFFNLPAALIVLGGTAGATLASVGLERFKLIPTLYRKAFRAEEPDLVGRYRTLVWIAELARREGLLAVDNRLQEVEDPFARKGLQLVVDGADPETVRAVLENEIDGVAARHHAAVQSFDKAGGLSPTMGILGTVMALVHVLKSLDQPETLGPAISGAFIATLYGVGAANLILFPVANRLKALSRSETELSQMTLEGVLSIQAGDNPRVVADKLRAFIPPAERSEDAVSPGPAAPPEADLLARADELAAA